MKIMKIAIIGAGWAGLQIGQVLIECGHNVSIFEGLDDVGGTWHPQMAYYGLTVHAPIFLCQFHDFDNWGHHNKLKKLDAIDIFENCKAYAKAKGLYKHIKFNTTVTQVKYNTNLNNCLITTLDTFNDKSDDIEFDFVISTHFNAPRIPKFPGQENFKGKIYHSNDIKESVFNNFVNKKSNVVLLGGSKSATDMGCILSKRNYEFKWVLKNMYSFICFDRMFYNYKNGKKASIFARYLSMFMMYLVSLKGLCEPAIFASRLLGVLCCPGKNSSANTFHLGILDSNQFKTVDILDNKIYSEISSIGERTITLTNGQEIDCDVLICATGCETFSKNLKIYRDEVQIKQENIERLYEHSVIPEIPALYFTGNMTLSYNGPINAYNRVACILKYIEEGLSTEQLKTIVNKEIKSIKDSRKGVSSPLFDPSCPYWVYVNAETFKMMKGIITFKDWFMFFYRSLIKHESYPYDGAEKFINARRKK